MRSEEQPQQHVADDFIINGPSNSITGITWWGGYDPRYTRPKDDFYIRIYKNVNGRPSDFGTEIYNTHLGSAVTRSNTNIFLSWGGKDWKVFRYEAIIPEFIASTGVSYWISITNDTSNPESTWWWSEDYIGNLMVGDQNSTPQWRPYTLKTGGSKAAFKLLGQTESLFTPGFLLLLLGSTEK